MKLDLKTHAFEDIGSDDGIRPDFSVGDRFRVEV